MGLHFCVLCGSSYREMLVAKMEQIIAGELTAIVCSQEPLSPHTAPAPASQPHLPRPPTANLPHTHLTNHHPPPARAHANQPHLPHLTL